MHRVVPIVLITLGVVLMVLGVVMVTWLFPTIIEDTVREEVALVEGNFAYDQWEESGVPIYFEVYIFNVTNPEDLSTGPLILQEVGPYVYRESPRKKVEVEFHANNSVTYLEKIVYIFDEERSEGRKETDLIFTINAGTIGLAEVLCTMSICDPVEKAIDESGEMYLVQAQVSEFVFSGFESGFMEKVYEFVPFPVKLLLPEYAKLGVFALLYGSNDTLSGPYEVHSGVGNSEMFTEILKYQNKENVSYWGDFEYCNMINGTDGVQFPPYIDTDNVLYIFSKDICRSMYLTFDGHYQLDVEDLDVVRFKLSEEVLYIDNPDNLCFICPDKGCQGSGVIDLSSCQSGAPIMMSTPHFTGGDKKFQKMFEGISPDPKKHDTYLDIDQITGTTLVAHKRIQINLFSKPVKHLEDHPFFTEVFMLNENKEGMVFPILWFDETATVDQKSAEDLKSEVYLGITILTVVQYVVIGVGFILTIVGGIFLYKHNKKVQTV